MRPIPTSTDRTSAGPPRARLAYDDLPALDLSIPPWPARTIEVAGASIVVRSTRPTGGAAEPALYVHGLGGSSTNWTDLAGLLATWLDGQAIDLPGFGHSGPSPDADYSVRAHARRVIGYLEQSARGRVHLFGNSLGGAISIEVAATRPDLVRTLTLVSPAVPNLRPWIPRDAFLPIAVLPGLGPMALRRWERMSPARRARAVIELCFAEPSVVPPNRMAEAIEEVRYRSSTTWSADAFIRSLRGLIAAYLARGGRSLWAQLGQIRVPTLVVWGDRDRLVDVAMAPRVARTVPNGRLLIIPRVGHVSQMEDPVTTARAVLGLLQDTRRMGG